MITASNVGDDVAITHQGRVLRIDTITRVADRLGGGVVFTAGRKVYNCDGGRAVTGVNAYVARLATADDRKAIADADRRAEDNAEALSKALREISAHRHTDPEGWTIAVMPPRRTT